VRSATIERQSFRLALAALSVSLAGCGATTDRALEETFQQVYPIEPTANITIKNDDGTVHIYGSPANEMRVEAIKRAYTRERLKQIAVNLSVQPGAVSIRTSFPPRKAWSLSDRSGTVDYTLVVPQTANISQLDMGNGEVLVEGMHGHTTRARLGNGRMFVHNCHSNVGLTMNRGTLTLVYDWWEPGKFVTEATIASGNVWAFLPSDAALHLIAETGNGKIANDFADTSERISDDLTKIDTSIHTGGEATIKIHAGQGNIKIAEANP
jgi:hypothetical protein